jgi:UDP-N-acetylmuramate--alanine ligase
MHIYFSGIGGTGLGPLSLIASQAGFVVSGSDKQSSKYTEYLKSKGVSVYIGQENDANIKAANSLQPIDWFVYSSALPLENPNHPEIIFCQRNNIKLSKRDKLLNHIIQQKKLKLIAIAGTHGKTTTTAMTVWAFKQLNLPISYSIGAKTNFSEMGEYNSASKYFIYECDEFDRNFLSFKPYYSLITNIDWDHQEIYPTKDNYDEAFMQFIKQSKKVIIRKNDIYNNILPQDNMLVIGDDYGDDIKLPGAHNRQNASLVLKFLELEFSENDSVKYKEILSNFPGTSRRFEKLKDNLFTDYAHTPEEIEATIQLAKEISDKILVVYEPLTNRRQHFCKEQYKNTFNSVNKLIWLPSYLAREDPTQKILIPTDLIKYMSKPEVAVSAEKNNQLWDEIHEHLKSGYLVLLVAGGGGGSLDEWARQKIQTDS